jgi:HAD superfamily hydrolase (TIGR01509 family)
VRVPGYRCVLFDWDGCLAGTLGLWVQVYRELLRERGVSVGRRVLVQELFDEWHGPERFGVRDVGQFYARFQGRLEELLPRVRLNRGAVEVVRELRRRGKGTAILSVSLRVLVEPILKRQGLEDAFDLVLTAEDVQRHKPDPEIVHRALEFFQACRAEALLVGDGDRDVRTGRNAGVATVLYFPPGHGRYYRLSEQRRSGPDHIIADLRELLPIAG